MEEVDARKRAKSACKVSFLHSVTKIKKQIKKLNIQNFKKIVREPSSFSTCQSNANKKVKPKERDRKRGN